MVIGLQLMPTAASTPLRSTPRRPLSRPLLADEPALVSASRMSFCPLAVPDCAMVLQHWSEPVSHFPPPFPLPPVGAPLAALLVPVGSLPPVLPPVGRVMLGRVTVGRVPVGRLTLGRVMLGRVMLGRVMDGRVTVGTVIVGTEIGGTEMVGTEVGMETVGMEMVGIEMLGIEILGIGMLGIEMLGMEIVGMGGSTGGMDGSTVGRGRPVSVGLGSQVSVEVGSTVERGGSPGMLMLVGSGRMVMGTLGSPGMVGSGGKGKMEVALSVGRGSQSVTVVVSQGTGEAETMAARANMARLAKRVDILEDCRGLEGVRETGSISKERRRCTYGTRVRWGRVVLPCEFLWERRARGERGTLNGLSNDQTYSEVWMEPNVDKELLSWERRMPYPSTSRVIGLWQFSGSSTMRARERGRIVWRPAGAEGKRILETIKSLDRTSSRSLGRWTLPLV